MGNPLEIQQGGDHYKVAKIQPVEYAEANQLGPCAFSVLKYISRYRRKNGLEDLKKALHYLQILMKLEYGVESQIAYEEKSDAEHVASLRSGSVVHAEGKAKDSGSTLSSD
jgi:hypothetical protein